MLASLWSGPRFGGGSSPRLCGQQLVVVGGALVVVLSVSDDCGQAFTDQSFCDVTGRGERQEKQRQLATSVQPDLPGSTWTRRDFKYSVLIMQDSCLKTPLPAIQPKTYVPITAARFLLNPPGGGGETPLWK